MGDLTKNLSASEFACDCNYSDCKSKEAAHMPLVLAIQDAVDFFSESNGCPAMVEITDGNRCFKNNVDIQIKWSNKTPEQAAASNSMHLYHIAADHRISLKVDGSWLPVEPSDLFDYYDSKYPNSCGIGLYSNRVHLDMRSNKARW